MLPLIRLSRLCLLAAAAGLLSIPPLPAVEAPGPARLAIDLEPGTQPGQQYLQGPDLRLGLARLGNRLVYIRLDGEQFPALWVTDGTPQGTGPLGVLCPPCQSAWALGSTGNLAFYQVQGSYPEPEMRLWRTDGTPAGTFPVTGKLVLSGYSSVVAGARLFFTGCTPELGCEPWSSDGTRTGTGPVGETIAGPGSAGIFAMAEAGGKVFVIEGSYPDGGRALWQADASGHGLRRLKTTPEAWNFVTAGNRLFFTARNAAGREVWTSDGTREGTRPVTSFGPEEPFGSYPFLRSVAGRIYFQADNGVHGFELWSLNPQETSPRRLTNFSDPQTYASVSSVEPLGNRVAFTTFDSHEEIRVWTSRGDLRSTVPLEDCPGGCPRVMSPLEGAGNGNRLLFYGRDRRGDGFWSTDGTGAGTRLLLRPHYQDHLAYAVSSGGLVLFAVKQEDGDGITKLWISDGSTAGTFLVGNRTPYSNHYLGDGPLEAETVNGRLVFAVFKRQEDGYAEALWSSDGSPAGTLPLTRIRVGKGSQPHGLMPFRDGLLVQGCIDNWDELRLVPTGETGNTSGNIAGNTVGTTLLRGDAEGCSGRAFSAPVDLGNIAVLLRTGPLSGTSLWRIGGTAEDASLLFPSGEEQGSVYMLVPFGTQAAFSVVVAPPGAYQVQIWATDGTLPGTRKLLDLPAGVSLSGLAGIGGKIYFFSVERRGEDVTWRPWVSDGTAAGTLALTALANPQTPSRWYGAIAFTGLGGRAFFWLSEGEGPVELWSSDGTPAGTGPVVSAVTAGLADPGLGRLEAVDGRLWFTARRQGDPSGRLLPWVSDGTLAGTVALEPPDTAGFDLRLTAEPFTEDGPFRFAGLDDGRVFFTAFDPVHGDDLWVTDGTPEGTRRVREDAVPGPYGFHPRGLTAWQGRLWFTARDMERGMELWTSDGSAQGTRLVQDIAPGASWSTPTELTAVGQSLYFSAYEKVHGRELWVLPAEALDP